MNRSLLYILGISFFTAVFFNSMTTHAQTAQVLFITWRAHTLAPAEYQGRTLPVRGARVTTSLAVFQNGALLDFSNREISWFLDNKRYQTKKGGVDFEFVIPAQAGSAVTVKAIILNTTQGNIEKAISLPVARPEIVIDAPYPGRTITPAAHLFRALPYNFTANRINQLLFRWSANGLTAEGTPSNPHELELSLQNARAGNNIILSVSASNPARPLESAAQSLQFIIQPQ